MDNSIQGREEGGCPLFFFEKVSKNLKKTLTYHQEEAVRHLTGLSQQAFANKYGIPKRTIENWESGVSTPPAYVIRLLADKVMRDKELPPRLWRDDDIHISKEGKYWTLYLGDVQMTVGDIEDTAEEMENITTRLEKGDAIEDIVKAYTECR